MQAIEATSEALHVFCAVTAERHAAKMQSTTCRVPSLMPDCRKNLALCLISNTDGISGKSAPKYQVQVLSLN